MSGRADSEAANPARGRCLCGAVRYEVGDNVGLLFRDLDRSRIQRGAVLTGI